MLVARQAARPSQRLLSRTFAGPAGPPARFGEVSLPMKKWWKGFQPVSGMETRTISPMQINVTMPLLKKIPHGAKHKLVDNFFDVAPAFALGIAIVTWSDNAFEAEVKKARD